MYICEECGQSTATEDTCSFCGSVYLSYCDWGTIDEEDCVPEKEFDYETDITD